MHRAIPFCLFLLSSLVALGCAGTHSQLKPEIARSLLSLAPGPASEPTIGITAGVFAGPARSQIGRASYYHSFFDGRTTANGERFSSQLMTAAHRTLDFGTRVRVTNLSNMKSVVVTINDRGPYVSGRIIDLSRRAASTLGFVHQGVARVRVEPLL